MTLEISHKLELPSPCRAFIGIIIPSLTLHTGNSCFAKAFHRQVHSSTGTDSEAHRGSGITECRFVPHTRRQEMDFNFTKPLALASLLFRLQYRKAVKHHVHWHWQCLHSPELCGNNNPKFVFGENDKRHQYPCFPGSLRNRNISGTVGPFLMLC